MKRCPRCNRIEMDEALKFCRTDGATLVHDSVASEVETSLLPHTTAAATARGTGPTTVLPSETAQTETDRLATPSLRRNFIIGIGVVIFVVGATVVIGSWYIARRNSAPIQSIAVIPFVNATGNAEADYLSDGLTESLINSLSQLSNLSVKARSTVFRYKNRDISPQQAGSELSVQAVLNGRVVQRGDQLTVSVDLVNARTGDQIWGQQYNGRMADAVALQAQIASDVSRRLQANFSTVDREKLNRRSTTNADAYLLYLKGRYQTAKYTKDGLAKGREYFDQAIAIDPRYALAYDGIADNYIAAADWFMPSKEALPRAGAAAKKALELDDTLAEAHASLATAHWWFDWDWPAAEMEFKRAIQLDPNDARARQFFGWFLLTLGKSDAAIAENKRAQSLDPLSVETNLLLGQSLYFARRYDEAIEQLRNTLDMDPNYWLAHSVLGRSYEEKGRPGEAIVEFQRALDLEKDVPENYAMLAHGYAVAGRKSEAIKLVDQLEDMSTKRHVPPYNIAIVYAGLGDKEQAFSWLERAYADRSFYLTWLKYDPQLDSLRSDPRFADLTRRVGLP